MIEIRRTKNATECPQKPANEGRTSENAPSTQPGLKREIKPFTGIDAARDYRAIYRAAFAFHEAHNPPTVDREYWRTHTPGEDMPPQAELDYWENAARDMGAAALTFAGDAFFNGLLIAIYEELEREYKAAQQQAANTTEHDKTRLFRGA